MPMTISPRWYSARGEGEKPTLTPVGAPVAAFAGPAKQRQVGDPRPSDPLSPPQFQSTLVISASRLLRDSLVETLGRSGRACAEAATLGEALLLAPAYAFAMVLLDAALPEGSMAATRAAQAHPAARLIVFGIPETEEAVLAWVEAGAVGYVPNTASVSDLMDLIDGIARGEQVCPSLIAGSLLRRLAAQAQGRAPATGAQPLTPREQEILGLVGAGLSNKDIARRLSISLGTTKSHVHNLFGKLQLQRRAELIVRQGASVQIRL
jgi:two-component system nitrate/nitrite response regulator NarL